jgi:hypothetical protein
VTDRDGAYAFTLPPGRYRIAPREDFEEERAFLEPESVFVDVSEKDALANVDLVLTRTGALTGTVLTDRGVVLPRASVGAASVRAGHVSDVRADEHGRFLLPLDEGTYWLTADGSDGRSGFVTSEPLRVELARGETREVQLLLAPSTIVLVRLIEVVDPVRLRLEALDPGGRSHAAGLPEEGLRRFELPSPGAYVLRGTHLGVAFARPLELGPWTPHVEMELRLDD